jgi:hypothetical protein
MQVFFLANRGSEVSPLASPREASTTAKNKAAQCLEIGDDKISNKLGKKARGGGSESRGKTVFYD